jgi:sortase A
MGTRMRLLTSRTRFIAIVAAVIGMSASSVHAASPYDGLLPDPARQPVFHRSQESGAVVGHLRIPAIGVDEVIRSGVAPSVIDRGVAHWAGTSIAGGGGNVVLAGHRTTHSQPFHDLDRLSPGDLVFVRDGSGFDVMYRVEDSFIVDPTAMWITYDGEDPKLTMFACHPKGSNRLRIVVTADLVAGRRIA